MIKLIAVIATIILSSNAYAECAEWLNTKIGKLHSDQQLDLCELTNNRPTLIVNTASHCGFTRQFKPLQALYAQYKDQGLQVIGFPSDSFNQAAANEAEAAEVCYVNFGVEFPMTQTVEVRGASSHAVFKHLAAQSSEPRWNFNKYLVDKEGRLVAKFGSGDSPLDPEFKQKIESVL